MSELLKAIAESDGDVRGREFVGEDLSGESLGHVEFEDCTFNGCILASAHLERPSFERCTLTGCDLGNIAGNTGFWRDSRAFECRLVGADLHKSVLVRTRFTGCNLSYVGLAESKLERVSFTNCDPREASLSQLRLRSRLLLEGCDLTRAELFQTRLAGVDLTSCNIAGIRMSDTFRELRDATVGIDQLPDLAGLLGVKLR